MAPRLNTDGRLPKVIEYPHDVRCIDTEQKRAGLACCYLVRGGDEYAFIECGTSLSVPGLIGVVEEAGLQREQVRYVIPTHVHLDHAGGAGLLMQSFPEATLVIHPRGARHMIDPKALVEGAAAVYGSDHVAREYGEVLPVPESRVRVVEDGAEIGLGRRSLRFMDAPGHARHHFVIWDEASCGWFTGDVFGLSYRELDSPDGAYLMPTTTPVQFEPDAWISTLDRLLAAEPRWMYLTHYGRVGDVQRLAHALRQGLLDYQVIAQRLRDLPGRHELLREALMRHSLEALRALRCPLDGATVRSLLELDIELNAQGLAVWLDRRRGAQPRH